MAKKVKFYGVRVGQDPITKEMVTGLIFNSWGEACKYTQGVKGAIHESFETLELAQAYVDYRCDEMKNKSTAKKPSNKRSESSKGVDNKKDGKYNKEAVHFYVDGSCTKEGDLYSYGVVIVKDERVIGWDYGSSDKETSMRQIAGELLGAMKSMLYAKKHGISHIVIFHDYVGVSHHATGFWKRKNELSERYYQWCQKFFSSNPGLKVEFCKVDAHQKDPFNELADGLAKIGVGIKPNPISVRLAETHDVSPLIKSE